MSKIQDTELSMLEAVEKLIQRKVKPQKFAKIAKEVFELMDVSEDLETRTAQLYTDLSLSGKFVALGDDMWDLKARQPFEVANYDTYDLDFEENESPTPLLGEDAPGIVLVEGESESEEVETSIVSSSDDYSDESDAQTNDPSATEHAGLSIYKEEDLQ